MGAIFVCISSALLLVMLKMNQNIIYSYQVFTWCNQLNEGTFIERTMGKIIIEVTILRQ